MMKTHTHTESTVLKAVSLAGKTHRADVTVGLWFQSGIGTNHPRRMPHVTLWHVLLHPLECEEWIAAQKIVAIEITDDLDEAWVDEAAFTSADQVGTATQRLFAVNGPASMTETPFDDVSMCLQNGDGKLQMGEFLEAWSMYFILTLALALSAAW
eukprot:1835261-Amphidinium_carterae.1